MAKYTFHATLKAGCTAAQVPVGQGQYLRSLEHLNTSGETKFLLQLPVNGRNLLNKYALLKLSLLAFG